MPRRIETDFLWAILQAVVGSFNSQDLQSYLNWAWSVINVQKLSCEKRKKTYPHICSSHMIQTFICRLYEIDRGPAQFILRCLGILLNCTALAEAQKVFASMCVALGSASTNQLTARHLQRLERRMKGLQDYILEDLVDDNEFTTNLEGTDKTEICKIKGSKFRICFADVYEDAMNMIEEQGGVR